MTTARRARAIEECRLCEQHEWTLGDAALPRVALGAGDLLDRATEMDRPGARARGGAPRNRRGQRPIHFVRAHAVSISFQLAAVPCGKLVTCKPEKKRRRKITQHGSGRAP